MDRTHFDNISSEWRWQADANLIVTYLSDNFPKLAGGDPQASLGRELFELFWFDVSDDVKTILSAHEIFHDALSSEKFLLSGEPHFDACGQFAGYWGVGRSTNREQWLLDELSRNEARFRQFAEMSADWFWEQDVELRFCYLSDQALRSFNLKPEKFYGKTRRETKPGGVGENQLQQHEAILTARAPFEDFRMSRVDDTGHLHHLTLSGRPFSDHAGKFAGYRGIARDITEQLETQRVLIVAKEQAEIASASKSNFLANFSHELRTPLNAVLGFSEMIQEQVFGPDAQDKYVEYAGFVHNSGSYLLELVSDILDLSKIEAGEFHVDDEWVSVPEAIDDAINYVLPQARDKELTVDVEISPDLPAIRSNNRVLQQLLLNLLSNAIKFTPQKGLVLVRAKTEQGGFRLTVQDDGVGIAASELERVTEPFSQTASARSSEERGSGLGLAIVKSMMVVMGGNLEVTSVIGEGTEATLVFPPERVAEDNRIIAKVDNQGRNV